MRRHPSWKPSSTSPQMSGEPGEAQLATSDARIIYTDLSSAYWVAGGRHGTNWIGRLLEVIRSELAATEAGVPQLPTHDADPPTSP
jgi:hypothetical protein